MMKRLLTIMCLAAAVLVGCKDDDEPVVGFAVDAEEITIGAEGGVQTLRVTGVQQWIATTDVPWLSISPANGIGSAQCQIRIDSTMSHDVRTANIRFVRTGQTDVVVPVHQLGFGRMVKADSTVYNIAPRATLDQRIIKAKVTSNVDFDVEIAYEGTHTGWLTVKDHELTLDRGSRPRTISLELTWKMNDVPEERVATVSLVPRNCEEGAEGCEFRVVQQAAPVIEDSRAGDSIAILLIHEKLQSLVDLDPTENMRNWNFITLWEKTDTALPCPEAVGRVRGVYFYMCDCKETLPAEFGKLKYLRALQVFSNVNSGFRAIELDTAICDLQYLKYLEIGAYGLVSLPPQFARLGHTLEQLDLTANNFERIPDVLCQENFPHLNYLCIGANRRWSTIDLRDHEHFAQQYGYDEGIGLYFDTRTQDGMRQLNRLFSWQNLETMRISYDYVEGYVPDYSVGETISYDYMDADGHMREANHTVRAWTADDIKQYGDTLNYVIGRPYIMPKCKLCGINLNFFTGSLPDWILHHPFLLEWVPEILTFNQQENGVNSDGKRVGFDNVPANFEYYYDKFPKWRSKYELQEEVTDEEAESVVQQRRSAEFRAKHESTSQH